MEVTYTLDRADYWQFGKYILWRTPTARARRPLFLAAYIVLLLFGVMWALSAQGLDDLIIDIVAVIIFGVGAPTLLYWVIQRQIEEGYSGKPCAFEARTLTIDPEGVRSFVRRVCGIVVLDLTSRSGPVLNAKSLHQDIFAERHRCADAHAQDMRHSPQEIGRAPTPDQHVAIGNQLEDFLSGVPGHALPVEPPPLHERSLALEVAVHLALGQAGALRDVVLDELMMDDGQSEPLRETRRNFAPARRHFPSHCDDGHLILP